MYKVKEISKLKEIIRSSKQKNKRIGFVPTMGALHKGHLSLVKKAVRQCDFVVVSIFVNPLQFGPNDDFKRYPRSIGGDERLLGDEKVDVLFCPSSEEMYKKGHSVFVHETFLSGRLCGRSRPGHFNGVCTVLAKLFNIIEPDIAYFGRKDYQQALIVKRLVDDLNFSVKIVIAPIVREKDKLAMSSRNTYLNKIERKESVCLYEGLMLAKRCISSGETKAEKIIERIRELVLARGSVAVDYIALVDPLTLTPVDRIKGKVLVALAVYFGNTRLIDNMIIDGKKK
jgi:pantoate--beta-alanine ligase